jgi:hypothetical protein
MDNSSSINVGHRVMSRKCKMSDKTQPNICQRLEVFVRWADLMHSVIIFCGKKERSPAWLARCLRLSCRMVPRGVPRQETIAATKEERDWQPADEPILHEHGPQTQRLR